MDDADPTITNPDFYRVLWENDDVRVLEYRDTPGEATTPHSHPNTVMVTLTEFARELSSGDLHREVSLPAGVAVWLPAQSHSGKNIGTTPTHTILIELKNSATASSTGLGPQSSD
jgi:quercetin dioxygenase-like cupin family protein